MKEYNRLLGNKHKNLFIQTFCADSGYSNLPLLIQVYMVSFIIFSEDIPIAKAFSFSLCVFSPKHHVVSVVTVFYSIYLSGCAGSLLQCSIWDL